MNKYTFPRDTQVESGGNCHFLLRESNTHIVLNGTISTHDPRLDKIGQIIGKRQQKTLKQSSSLRILSVRHPQKN